MGMDIYGVRPQSDKGKYSRFSVWSWRPMLDLIADTNTLPPELLDDMAFNDGAGPDGPQSLLLAAGLEALVNGMPDDAEFLLELEVNGVLSQIMNAVRSTGAEVKGEPMYSTSVARVREFIEFCRDSGGFEVW